MVLTLLPWIWLPKLPDLKKQVNDKRDNLRISGKFYANTDFSYTSLTCFNINLCQLFRYLCIKVDKEIFKILRLKKGNEITDKFWSQQTCPLPIAMECLKYQNVQFFLSEESIKSIQVRRMLWSSRYSFTDYFRFHLF